MTVVFNHVVSYKKTPYLRGFSILRFAIQALTYSTASAAS